MAKWYNARLECLGRIPVRGRSRLDTRSTSHTKGLKTAISYVAFLLSIQQFAKERGSETHTVLPNGQPSAVVFTKNVTEGK